jgi:FKBP-type peptidyl-prolyl cis-trans isomerase SlyD
MTDAENTITPGKVIGFHYDLYDSTDEPIESTEGGPPMLFLYGERNVLAVLQEAFLGRVVGDDFSVEVPHEKAYGRHYPQRIQRVSKKKIDSGGKSSFQIGQILNMRTEQGPQPATIIKVGKFNLDVDANHPLAGRDLRFDVKIMSIRDATEEERQHGHAHGLGGHNH